MSLDKPLRLDVPATPGEMRPVPAAGDDPLRIVFMGTPDFAVPCLKALIDSGDAVIEVVAQPDKPAGRGRKLNRPPTILLAEAHGIPTRQPKALRSGAFPKHLAALKADLFVVVAYGRILPQAILDMPRLGCINVHASLLPAYRGAGPIQRALLEGDDVTGVTTMFMDVGMDTGDMLRMSELSITPEDTGETLHDRLSPLGAELLLSTIRHLKAGTLTRTVQIEADATAAPMLSKKDGDLDWARPAQALDWHVRGMTPWPGAFTFLDGQRLGILAGIPHPHRSTGDAAPGTILASSAEGLEVATGEGSYLITQLKPAGKRAMAAQAYLLGHPVAPGARLHPAPPEPGA